jgi:hypothetical protein
MQFTYSMPNMNSAKNKTWKWINRQLTMDQILEEKESNTLDYKEMLYCYQDTQGSGKKKTPMKTISVLEPVKLDYKKLSYVMIKYLIAFLNTNGRKIVVVKID